MRTIEWRDGTVFTIDQTKLPSQTVMLKLKSPSEVARAIETMKIRGAPLLGVSAAFGLALAAYRSKAKTKKKMMRELDSAAKTIKRTRPTAVNLFWALDRIIQRAVHAETSVEGLRSLIICEAQKIADEDAASNRLIGEFGAELLDKNDTVLTHCNAGALATVDYGTALGVIRAACEQGKNVKVVATETRPLLQGARLTTCELQRDGIPVTLITDNMVGYVMKNGMVDKAIVGADRIVKDAVFNKIGTYSVAVLAKEHRIPFYVAAPTSTFDLVHTSEEVVIEQRRPQEVTHFNKWRTCAEGIKAINPAFDVTPLKYVTAVISERGILRGKDLSSFLAKRTKDEDRCKT